MSSSTVSSASRNRVASSFAERDLLLSEAISRRLDAYQECHLEPLPVAVDVIEAELAQPLELAVHIE